MTDADKIAEAILQKIKDDKHIFWIDPKTHADQHEFLQVLMVERAEKITRRKALEDKIAGSLLLSAIIFLIGMLGAGLLEWIRPLLRKTGG